MLPNDFGWYCILIVHTSLLKVLKSQEGGNTDAGREFQSIPVEGKEESLKKKKRGSVQYLAIHNVIHDNHNTNLWQMAAALPYFFL